MEVEEDEEASDEERETSNLPPEEGEMLMTKRVFMPLKSYQKPFRGSKLFTPGAR